MSSRLNCEFDSLHITSAGYTEQGRIQRFKGVLLLNFELDSKKELLYSRTRSEVGMRKTDYMKGSLAWLDEKEASR